MQGRIAKLSDVSSLAQFFFVEPDYTTDEAQKMWTWISSHPSLPAEGSGKSYVLG